MARTVSDGGQTAGDFQAGAATRWASPATPPPPPGQARPGGSNKSRPQLCWAHRPTLMPRLTCMCTCSELAVGMCMQRVPRAIWPADTQGPGPGRRQACGPRPTSSLTTSAGTPHPPPTGRAQAQDVTALACGAQRPTSNCCCRPHHACSVELTWLAGWLAGWLAVLSFQEQSRRAYTKLLHTTAGGRGRSPAPGEPGSMRGRARRLAGRGRGTTARAASPGGPVERSSIPLAKRKHSVCKCPLHCSCFARRLLSCQGVQKARCCWGTGGAELLLLWCCRAHWRGRWCCGPCYC